MDWTGLCNPTDAQLEVGRQVQHLELFDMFLKPLLSNVCCVVGHIFLLKEATAIGEYHCHEGIYMICNNV